MSEATAMKSINNPNASSAIVPMKRRRGRPRKHPKVDHLDRSGASHSNFSSGGVNGSHQSNSVNNNDIMLGQPVIGVIEAVFDAGYLLSVRIGNSDTNLKGVVFKPGHYIPVSAENDVAPGVQMIPRHEFPIPREAGAPIRRRRYRTRERNGASRGTSRVVASRGSQVHPLMMTQTAASPGISRGNVVPVVLHPVTTVSNGVATATSKPYSVAMAPHLMMGISKGKGVADVAADPLLSGPSSSFAQQLAEAEKQAQTGFVYNSSTTTKPQHEAGGKSTQSAADSGFAMGDDEEEDEYEEDDDDDEDDDEDDGDQPLTVEPLQTIQPHLNHPPAVVAPQHMANYTTGKMTELLQVVQKNVMENQVMQAGQPSRGGTEQRE